MGSSASKAVGKAASKSPRQFRSRPPGSMSAGPPRARPSQSTPAASTEKTDAVTSDAMDPDAVTESYSQRLHKMGIVDPNPTYSPSSTAPEPVAGRPQYPPSGPGRSSTLSALENRSRLQEMATTEFEGLGLRGSQGREFLDVGTIARILVMRERGVSSGEIESSLKLKAGVVDRLGSLGVVAPAGT